MIGRLAVRIPDVGVGAAVLRGKGLQEPNLAFPLGMPPQDLIALGLFHDQDQIRPCDHLGGQGPGPVPGAVQTFFPEDGNGLGIGVRAPEI